MRFRKKLKIASKKNLIVNLYTRKNIIKSYNGKTNRYFYSNKIPVESSQYICLSVILINSVFRIGNNYYPQVFLEECKHVVKEKKMPKYITDNMEISSDDSDKEDSNEENSDEENSHEESSIEEN